MDRYAAGWERPAAERSLWDRVVGDIVVCGVKRGQPALFSVLYLDNTYGRRSLPVSRIMHNDGCKLRIVGVPPGEKHRIYWVTGPCASPLHRLAQIAEPEIRRYVRRERLRRALRRLRFWQR